MKTIRSLIALLLAAIIGAPTFASTPPGATMGPVTVTGNLVSGGNIHYQFDLNAAAAGSLVVKATIKGTGFKVTLPVLQTTPPAGASTVTGPTLAVPAGFVGSATMKLTAKFNNKKLGNATVTFVITVPPPPVLSPTAVTLYDQGFENLVTLNGAAVPTTGMGAALTYAWTQTAGKTVTLSATNVATPTFTTDAVTNFVNMGTTIFVNDIDDAGYTNAMYVTPEHRFGTVNGLALDNEQVTASTYGFQLLVSDGAITRTGTWSVACATQTPAQPNIPVGVPAFYKGATNSTAWTLLAKPAGSTATLQHSDGLIAQLQPDVEGVYIIQDTVTGQTLTNTAASWTGVQFCAICHGPGNNVNQKDIVTPWSQTLHSTMAQRGVDGVLSSHYSEACYQCHTVGFNKSPAATNGNWYAVQQQVGWVFPSILKPGNFAAMPTELQAKANIQCENCHGPGSRHPGAPSISLDVKVCASCHQNGTNHVHPEQWEISPHAGAYENISSHGTSASCARCHAPAGFISVAQGVSAGITNASGANAVATGTGPATCQVCHDPHDTFGNPDRHQLRVYDTTQLGNPLWATSPTITIGLGDSLTMANLQLTNSTVTVTNAGASAACMVCHNAREWPTQVQVSGANSGKMYYATTAPSMSTAGDIYAGGGGCDNGQTMGNSFHTYLADCQACHMYQLKAGDTILVNNQPVAITANNLASYVNVLGDHTFEMDYTYADTNGVTNVVQNIAACNQCHASFEPVGSFDFQPANGHDYDGDGSVDGIQTETQGVLGNLAYLLLWGNNGTGGVLPSTGTGGIPVYLQVTSGTNAPVVVVTNSTPIYVTGFSTTAKYYSATNSVSAAQHRAAWNWALEYHEGSFGVHNTQFTIRLLQSSYTDLGTNFTGNAANTYQAAFPKAYLR